MKNNKLLLILLVGILGVISCSSKENESVVSYNLKIEQSVNNINGKPINTYTINDSSPGPVLMAKVGQTMKITVKNKTSHQLILHWHGLLVPNSMDGVGNVTGPHIESGKSFTYEFLIKQTGTYWYHAHDLEEAEGIYGGIILSDENNADKDFKDTLLVYSGDLGKNAIDVLKEVNPNWNPDMADHSKQDSTESAIMDHSAMGHTSHTTSTMDHSTMKEMNMSEMNHYSDVSYRQYLINGSEKSIVINPTEQSVKKIRLVNAYADGFLNFVYSGGDFQIVGSDGLPVKPVTVSHLRVAMGETYDILLPIFPEKQTELVTFFLGDDTGYSRVLIGNGKEEVKLKSYKASDYSTDQPYNLLETIPVNFITQFPEKPVDKTYNIDLTGTHSQYDWAIMMDGNKLSTLDLKVGQKIVFKIKNTTMMPHPMHLHGHFFKIASAKNYLMKHTINLDPMETIEIEIEIDTEGKWLFHCHNLFHMASGMATIIDVK